MTDSVAPVGGLPEERLPSVEPPIEERLRYLLLTGPDDEAFCRRVSDAMADGYRLQGSPAITTRHGEVLVAQALVLADGGPSADG